MAKKQKKQMNTQYLSALCGIGNAVSTANEWDAKGYFVAFCFPVNIKDEEGNFIDCIYMLGCKEAHGQKN